MKIGLIGFFGVGAYSDDMINITTQKIFRNINPGVTFDSNVMWRCAKGAYLDYLNGFDLLVLCGGSLLGKCTFPPINRISEWAHKLYTPLSMFGTAYRLEPDKEPLSPTMQQRMKLLFETAQVIMLRGKRSIYWCNRNEISTEKVEALGDPLLGLSYEKKKRRDVIGGNVRNMPPSEVQYTSNDYVQGKMATIYEYLIDLFDLPLEFYVFRDQPLDNDGEGALKTMMKMKDIDNCEIRRFDSAWEAFNSIDMQFWFGQRLHPAVFCAATKTSFIGLDTQFEKMKDFMSSINSSNYIDVRQNLDDFKEIFKAPKANDSGVESARKRVKATAKKIVELGIRR